MSLLRLRLLTMLMAALLVIAGCSTTRPTATADVQDAQEQQEDDDDLKPYGEVITAEMSADEGLFTIHRADEELYYEIPDSLFGEEMLLVSRTARTATGIGYGGNKVHTRVVRWQRREGEVLLREVSYQNVADPEDPIYRAVEHANFEPILMSFDIEALNRDSNTVVIEVTDLYTTDVPALGLGQGRREAYEVRGLDGDRTFITSTMSFPRNIEIDHVLTYQAQDPPSNASTNTISLEMSQSMIMLPQDPMTTRACDERVGYFSVRMTDYSADAQQAVEQCYITRWRLVPSDKEAYMNGELVEPIEPIVFYVGPGTPEKWRPYIKAGIEAWQEAFRAAGFKNAIIAKAPPTEEENPNWSPEDVRYAVVRWLPSRTQNAYGPHVHDPRTGEILDADIGMYHNVMSLLRDWYFVQTAAANPEARAVNFDTETMGRLIQFVVAHEVGHSLGMPHNWGSSYAYPVDSLRSPTFTSTHGTAPSIMDYARFNYIAQPGDGVTDFIPEIGEYDVWAVKWGYSRFPQMESAEAREDKLDEWIMERAGNPVYFYGVQTGPQIDPRSQAEDLGRNAVKASTLGLKNLKRIVPNLIEWTYREGEDYEELEELYEAVLGQWELYIGHVTRQIGGVRETPKNYEQEGFVYEPVPLEQQLAAMEFLQEKVFTKPTWLLEEEVLRRIERTGMLRQVQQMQAEAVDMLLDPQRLARLIEIHALHAGEGEPVYAPAAMLEDLRRGLWSELRTGEPIGTFRRNLQRAYINQLEFLMTEDPDGPPREYWGYFDYQPIDMELSGIRPLVRGELLALQENIREALPGVEDRRTRLHLQATLARIDEILTPDEEVQAE